MISKTSRAFGIFVLLISLGFGSSVLADETRTKKIIICVNKESGEISLPEKGDCTAKSRRVSISKKVTGQSWQFIPDYSIKLIDANGNQLPWVVVKQAGDWIVVATPDKKMFTLRVNVDLAPGTFSIPEAISGVPVYADATCETRVGVLNSKASENGSVFYQDDNALMRVLTTERLGAPGELNEKLENRFVQLITKNDSTILTTPQILVYPQRSRQSGYTAYSFTSGYINLSGYTKVVGYNYEIRWTNTQIKYTNVHLAQGDEPQFKRCVPYQKIKDFTYKTDAASYYLAKIQLYLKNLIESYGSELTTPEMHELSVVLANYLDLSNQKVPTLEKIINWKRFETYQVENKPFAMVYPAIEKYVPYKYTGYQLTNFVSEAKKLGEVAFPVSLVRD